jgi:tRNA nucleotidyltransferase (CCA-adding enzyme)
VGQWELFHHGADIGIRGIGKSKAEAFEQAATALVGVITNPEAVMPKEIVEMTCQEADDELCLVDWLNALVYEMATRRMLFGRFEVKMDGETLHAKAWGEPVDIARHQPAVEVKGATFTELQVRRDPDGTWIAQCVVDV